MTTKEDTRKLNRIKAVLAETRHIWKWVAEPLGKDPAAVSRWCSNTSQSDLCALNKIVSLLDFKFINYSTKSI